MNIKTVSDVFTFWFIYIKDIEGRWLFIKWLLYWYKFIINLIKPMKQKMFNQFTKYNMRDKVNFKILNEQMIKDISVESFGWDFQEVN